MSLVLQGLVLVYRYLVAPVLPRGCRYEPSCSVYALEALQRHGCWRGGRLALTRLLSCHPWGGTGFDPVPHQPPSAGCRSCATRHSHPPDASEASGPPV